MFTLEIGDKPIAATDADEGQARAIFESDEFKQDLTALTSDGVPLWDRQAPLTIRAASAEEIAAFEAPDMDLDDDVDPEEEDEDGLFVTFLVPIDHDHEDVSTTSTKPAGSIAQTDFVPDATGEQAMFTLEIGGRPVAMTDASEERAYELFHGQMFKAHLGQLVSQGHRLWDGTAPLVVRPSSKDEIVKFKRIQAAADEEQDDEEELEAFSVVYLVEAEEDEAEVG
jgi:hypothetical protein